MRKLFIAIVAVAFLVSCGNTETKNEKTSEEKVDAKEMNETKELECEKIYSPDSFLANAEKLVANDVRIEGTVIHVCEHGGGKMFLTCEESEDRVKILLGEGMQKFNTDMVGSDVYVEGVVEELRIDEEYLQEWQVEIDEEQANPKKDEEKEHAEGEEGEEEVEHAHGGHGEQADQGEHVDPYEKIENFRTMIAESGTDHVSFYSIVAHKMKIKE